MVLGIDPTVINEFLGALTALLLFIIAYYNKQRTTATQATAASTAQMAATAETRAQEEAIDAAAQIKIAVPNTIGDDFTPGGNVVTNPLLLGDSPTVQIGGTTYHPVYHMSEQTRRAVLGQLAPDDMITVANQIAAAEEQRGGLGIPHYIVKYSHGYYEINFTVRNVGNDTFYASAILNSSHDQQYDPVKAAQDAQAGRVAAAQAAADKAAAELAAAKAVCAASQSKPVGEVSK